VAFYPPRRITGVLRSRGLAENVVEKIALGAPQMRMAFIRKRGESYYLVHQIHLACLGRRPRISDDVVRGVSTKHPFVRVNWKELREKASRDVVQPFQQDARYLRDMLAAIRNLHLDLADMPLQLLGMAKDRDLSAQFVAGLKLLRSTLDVKLQGLRKVKAAALEA
jgi:hypothetical protein